MSTLALVALVGACNALHPFHVQMHDRHLQQQMWWQDRYGVKAPQDLKVGPKAEYFTQYQDHFDGTNSKTWHQAYFTNATYYRPGGPVFICVGGEGPALDGSVVVSSVHCNVAVEFLKETGAIMFALEHRYYGCHNLSACPVSDPAASGALRYLSSRQALSDLARFHEFATEKYNTTGKWVSFGGSYPGMLAGWFRLKFPHLVHASIASSAPVRAELDMVGYNDVVAYGYSVSDNNVGGSQACMENIADGHAKIKEMFGTSSGRQELSSLFGESASFFESYDNQMNFAGNGVAQFPAQSNDPTCTRAGCNIKKICEVMTNTSFSDNVRRLASLVKSQDAWATRKWRVQAPMDWADYWGYQTCTEFAFYQTCEVGSKCFYAQGYVTLASMDSFCKTWNVDEALIQRNVDFSNQYYGSDKPAGNCVMYPNGEVDPWKANSVLVSPSQGIDVLMVGGASHHAWTHPSADNDQDSVKQARLTIRKQIQTYLGQDCDQAKQ